MKSIVAFVLIVVSGLSVTCPTVWGQATAQITGIVRDPSGAVLPGVEVKGTQTETGISRTAITNETGAYILPNLAVGRYRLEAALPGFRTFVQTDLLLQVNSNPAINITMEIGQVSESVEVQANAAQVETRSTAVGQVIENERILELPLNGRQVTDLITLSGAAVQTAVSDNKSWQGGALISIAGGQSFGVSYSLDGAMHSNVTDGSQLPLPFPDALQEFKVEASGTTANSGMKSGGSVNAVTKSGTNDFHGDAFEFVRNYDFNARNFFAANRDSLKRNQYGGTVGGPIIKNKLFFFAGYQGTKTRSDPTQTISFIPTAAVLAGDFTAITSPTCNAGRQITLKAPFVNNRIDPSLFDPAAMKVVSMLPNTQDPCGTINWGSVTKSNEWQLVDKIDYQINAKHSIFGRTVLTTLAVPVPYAISGNLLTSVAAGWDNLAHSYALGDTYLIGPNTVNAFRLTVNRTSIDRVGASFFGPQDIGVKASSNPAHAMAIVVSGGFQVGNGSFSDLTVKTTAYQMSDEVSIIRGNHQMAFGGSVADWRSNDSGHTSSLGTYTFNGSNTGLGMADFFTGKMSQLSTGTRTIWDSRQAYILGYAQDVWKLTPKFTANFGLRWEPIMPLNLVEGTLYSFDLNRFQQGIHSTVIPSAPAGLNFHGDPGFPSCLCFANPVWKDFAPRLGFAWDPKGDGKTSLRASYGLAYDFGVSESFGGAATAPPKAIRTTVSNPVGGFDDPWRGFPGGNPYPFVYDPSNPQFTPVSQYISMLHYDMKTPMVQTWNLSIQRQVPSDFLVSMSYLGSHTTHLWMQRAVNRAVYIPGASCTIAGVVYSPCSSTSNTDQRRALLLQNQKDGQAYGAVDLDDDGGSATYNGLLLSIQRRALRGVNIGGNYTLSHCIGDATPFNNSANNNTYLDPNNRRFDRGNCDSDRRQIFNLTAVADSPHFANALLRAAGTGWRLSGIYRRSAGPWMTATTGVDRALSGDINPQRPNQVLGNPYGDTNSLKNYLNPNAFAQPDLGTIGNMRKYNLLAPAFWNLDMALSRVFQIREGQRIEFRAEGFNVTNSLRKMPPTTALNSNTFGQITSAYDPRIMQFALKYSF